MGRRWGTYVSVDKRRAKAAREVARLRKKGQVIEPVEVAGRQIALEFWGKRWCDHIESFSDYENRLPRGRTYVRNGSVCHLEVERGKVVAMVSGSRLYYVSIVVDLLNEARWQAIRDCCSGKVSSLIELLSGELSSGVMEVVSDPDNGLFPRVGEIRFGCTCPDGASMCKHIAAVLYGIGSRLDVRPDLLFLLRGVEPSELIGGSIAFSDQKSTDALDEGELSSLFDIELDGGEEESLTGDEVRRLREMMGMKRAEFARLLEVTSASIYRWERASAPLNLREGSRRALLALRNQGSKARS